MRLLDSDAALYEALSALAAQDDVMRTLLAKGARPNLRKRDPGFAGLAAIIVGQQLSIASARAILARLEARFGELNTNVIEQAGDGDLKSCGLSAPKIRTLRAICTAVDDGLDLDALADMAATDAHERLTAIKGIGPWTADIYLLFCLGHPDAFPAGDLALQESAKVALGLDARPTARELEVIAERWRPWRGAAAKVLWSHYHLIKQRDVTALTST